MTSRITGLTYRVLQRRPVASPGRDHKAESERPCGRAVTLDSSMTTLSDRTVRECENRRDGCRKARALSPEELSPLEEIVFCGEAGSLGARVQSQLAVDRPKVPIDGARTEEELPGDLGVGQPCGDQA